MTTTPAPDGTLGASDRGAEASSSPSPLPRWGSADDLSSLVSKRSELLLAAARHRARIQRLSRGTVLAEAGLGSARLALALLVNRARTAGFLLDEDEAMERASLIETQAREQASELVSLREEMERSWVREQEIAQELSLLDDRIAELRAQRSAAAFQAAWDAVVFAPELSDVLLGGGDGDIAQEPTLFPDALLSTEASSSENERDGVPADETSDPEQGSDV